MPASQHSCPTSDFESSQAASRRLIADVARERLGIAALHRLVGRNARQLGRIDHRRILDAGRARPSRTGTVGRAARVYVGGVEVALARTLGLIRVDVAGRQSSLLEKPRKRRAQTVSRPRESPAAKFVFSR